MGIKIEKMAWKNNLVILLLGFAGCLCEACFIYKVNCAVWAVNLLSERDPAVTPNTWFLPGTPIATFFYHFFFSPSSQVLLEPIDLRSVAHKGLLCAINLKLGKATVALGN